MTSIQSINLTMQHGNSTHTGRLSNVLLLISNETSGTHINL